MYYLNEIAELESFIGDVNLERYHLEKSTNLKVAEVLNGHFNPFQEFEVKVNRSSATFYLINDEDGSIKEMFDLYFDERYKQKDELRLSYYSTSTHSDFELQRLVRLGNVASVIRCRSEIILNEIHQVIKSDLERSNELYSIQNGYQKKIAEYQKANSDRRKVEIELALKSDGVTFDSRRYITLKRNYDPQVDYIKIVEVSKSGKTCVVEYSTGYSTSREENCNTQNVIGQVTSLNKHIVSTSELV